MLRENGSTFQEQGKNHKTDHRVKHIDKSESQRICIRVPYLAIGKHIRQHKARDTGKDQRYDPMYCFMKHRLPAPERHIKKQPDDDGCNRRHSTYGRKYPSAVFGVERISAYKRFVDECKKRHGYFIVCVK